MLAEIGAGLSSLKAMKDLVQAINTAKGEAGINSVKIELQGLILDAQQGLFAAQEAQSADTRRIAELNQEIARLKDWSAEKERYDLVRIDGGGALVYMPREGMESGEPAHWLCANCFSDGCKSYLQFQGNQPQKVGGPTSTYSCDRCKASVVVPWGVQPDYSQRKIDS